MNLNGEDKNDKSLNNDDSKLKLSDPGYLSQNSVKIELLNNKKLINFCEYHNELLLSEGEAPDTHPSRQT